MKRCTTHSKSYYSIPISLMFLVLICFISMNRSKVGFSNVLFLFNFSCIGTSHLLNRFLFDVNCAIMRSFCLPLYLSFHQSTLSIIGCFCHLACYCFHDKFSSPHLRSIASYSVRYRFEFTFDEVLFPSCGIRSFMQSSPLIRLKIIT